MRMARPPTMATPITMGRLCTEGGAVMLELRNLARKDDDGHEDDDDDDDGEDDL